MAHLTADGRNVAALADAPVFIVGAPRSGTTWVQRLLLEHPAVCGGQESHFFSAFSVAIRGFDAHMNAVRQIGLPCYWTRDAFLAEMVRLWRATMRPMIDDRPAAAVLLEKTPGHALEMDVILRVLPKARFIHVIRDSRAVVASMLAAAQAEWGVGWAPRNCRDAALLWWQHVTAARQASRGLGQDQCLEIAYESLLHDPTAGVRTMARFIGVDMSPDEIRQMVSRQQIARQKADGGSQFKMTGEQATAGPHREPAGFFRKGLPDSWKTELSIRQKLVVWRYTRKLMRQLGYDWSGWRAQAGGGPAPVREPAA